MSSVNREIEREVRLMNKRTLYRKINNERNGKMEKLSEQVIESVFDGDLNTKLSNVEYSTSAREVVTVGFMVESVGGDLRA